MRAVRAFFELIKFEHTIFALPFAYLGMLLAAEGLPSLHQFGWITAAMASARTLAMGFNRIVDRAMDARNPRTANRPLVTGEISLRTAWIGIAIAGGIFLIAAWQLGRLTLLLSPIAILFLLGYSLTKRFTWSSHFILGFTDGMAPAGAWAAVRQTLFTPNDLPAWILLVTVTFWIGGFDLIYACQDVAFDRRAGLYAIPARFGIAAALRLAKVCHVITTLLLILLGAITNLGLPYWIGVLLVIGLLAWEHSLVRPDDLSRVNVAFFNVNGYISLILVVSVFMALFLP